MGGTKTVRLGPGSEFDLIRSFLAGPELFPQGILVGPGDDCAVLDAGRLALTCDITVEEVHFRRSWLSPEEVGWRAGAASLSDLAAVAARPLALLVSLAVTEEDAGSGWARRVTGGLSEVAEQAGAVVVGGDLTRSPGPAVIDVVSVGTVPAPVLRDGARAGDEVWVTGRLGGAGAALALLEADRGVPENLRAAFARPTPRWREALWLCERVSLHALIDLSDGALGDAGHVAAASGTRLELEGWRVPLAPGLEGAMGEEGGLERALGGGEDYELLLVVPPDTLAPSVGPFQDRFHVPLTLVGRVSEGEGVWIREREGGPLRRARGGFSHFDLPSEGSATGKERNR